MYWKGYIHRKDSQELNKMDWWDYGFFNELKNLGEYKRNKYYRKKRQEVCK